MQKRYVIAFSDPEIDPRPAYWITRCGDTDNYDFDETEATSFASRSAAYALIKALDLVDHQIKEIKKEDIL